MGKKDIRTVAKFNKLTSANRLSGKSWHHNLNGSWWCGMSEDDARRYITKFEEEEKALLGKIVLASTWNISCGIATYTRYLFDSLDKISSGTFAVNPINKGLLKYKNDGRLTHLQHEFGIVPEPPKIGSKLIVTWHTVSKHTNDSIEEYEYDYDVVAHIVHTGHARQNIESSADVWAIPHGSMLIPEMKKEDARRLLGINIDIPIGFVFGFQSGDKNYGRLIDAASDTGMHLIISGAPHNVASLKNIPNDRNVTFINRFLVENEVNLYASASDILLFDYAAKDHFSVSGAMHRIIGAGRPVICSDVNHFGDIENGHNCLKFKDRKELERCIRDALRNSDQLGIAARNYAQRTSWENIARRHIEIYKRYTNV